MKALSKNDLSVQAEKQDGSLEETFEAFEAREDVRAVFMKIQKSKGFTRKAAEKAFAGVAPIKK